MTNQSFDLSALRSALSDGRLTAVELAEICFRRIEHTQCRDRFVFLNQTDAMEAARASDARRAAGQCLGDLDGIPFAAEDRFCVKGTLAENNCGILRGYCPPYDADAVKRLLEAGAVLVGKLKTDGFLSGSAQRGTVRSGLVGGNNPLPFALLADTGGSLLCHGEENGVACVFRDGSRRGMFSCAPSFDGVGILVNSVQDGALLMPFLADRMKKTTFDKSVTDLKIAFWKDGENCTDLRSVLKRYGTVCNSVTLLDCKQMKQTYRILSSVETASEMAMLDGIRFGMTAEGDGTARKRVAETRGRFFSFEEQRLILLGTALLMGEHREGCYRNARAIRSVLHHCLSQIFDEYDLLVCSLSDDTVYLPGLANLSGVSGNGLLLMAPQGCECVLFEVMKLIVHEGGRLL